MQSPSAESQRVFAPEILRDQVVLVTGGGSGIGLATALEMTRLGAKVAICGRTADKLEVARAQLAAIGDVHAATCDIREPDQVQKLVADILAKWGRLDVVVNNAGGQFPSPAQLLSPNGFAAVIKNNLAGTFHVCREVANQWMIPNKTGRIINVIANIYRGFPGMVHTGA